jgi:hypothetical protein
VAIDSIHKEPTFADANNFEAESSKTTWVIDYWFLFHLFDLTRERITVQDDCWLVQEYESRTQKGRKRIER